MLRGQARPEGLGAIIYHGLLHGLAVIMRGAKQSTPRNLGSPVSHTTAPVLDAQLIGLLANMLLQVRSEVQHVI